MGYSVHLSLSHTCLVIGTGRLRVQSNNEFTLHSCAITNSVRTEISGIVFIHAIGDGVKSGWGWGGDRDGDGDF